jgi:4-hydroxybenzoate polyprenyltransferase
MIFYDEVMKTKNKQNGLLLLHEYLFEKIRAFIHLGRPAEAVRPIVLSLIGSLLVSSSHFNLARFFLLALSLLFFSVSIVAFNDLADYAIDTANRVRNPLTTSLLNRKEVALFSFLCVVLSFLFSLSLRSFAITACLALSFFLGLLYSHKKTRWSHSIPLSIFCISLGTVASPLLMGSFLSGAKENALFVPFSFFIIVLSIPLASYKDFRDIRGDSRDGKRTLFTCHRPDDVLLALLLLSGLFLVSFVFFLHQEGFSISAIALWSLLLVLLQARIFAAKERLVRIALIRLLFYSFNLFLLQLALMLVFPNAS